MQWKDIIGKTDAYLSAKGVPDPRVASELLAARLLGIGRGLISSILDNEANEDCLEAMRRAMKRLASGEPLQYVLGEWDFRSLTLKCDRRALIPRPETEELVSRVLKFLCNRRSEKQTVVDIGTGTGAIILSLAKEFDAQALFIGTDLSADAIALAKENAAICGLSDKVRFVVADGLDDFDEPECVDVLVSNPPYIESGECGLLDRRIIDFEPRMALDGGVDGMDFYRRYLGDALNILRSGGGVFFEIGEKQGESLRNLMIEYGFSEVLIEKDFAGHDRYASAVLK